MKRKIIVFSLVLMSISLMHCEKDVINHMDDYIGDWQFNVIQTQWNMSWEDQYGYISITDTIDYLGSIDYGIGSDIILRVKYLPSEAIGITVNKEEDIYRFETGYFYGYSRFFGVDSVVISMQTQALGDGVKYFIRGNKQ